ncbi:hypothetical protein ACYJEJ_001671 [Proteus mirabilis]
MNSKIKGHWFLIQWIPNSFTREKFNVGVGIKYQEKDGTLNSHIKTAKKIDKLSEWYCSTLDNDYTFITEIIKSEFAEIGLKETKKDHNIEYLHMGITPLEYHEYVFNNFHEKKLNELAKQYLSLEKTQTINKLKHNNLNNDFEFLKKLTEKCNIQFKYFNNKKNENEKLIHEDVSIYNYKLNEENISEVILEMISSIEINVDIKIDGYEHGQINEIFDKVIDSITRDKKNEQLSVILLEKLLHSIKNKE